MNTLLFRQFATLLMGLSAVVTLGQASPTLELSSSNDDEGGTSRGHWTSVREGQRAILKVTRRGDRELAVSVDLRFAGSRGPDHSGLEATPGVDFQAVHQRVELARGETERLIEVPVLEDGEVEYVEEFFTATLSNASAGAEIGIPSVAIGIVNNGQNRDLPTTLDVTFDPWADPLVLFEALDSQMPPYAVNLLPLPDGKKLAVGDFTSVNGVARPGLARLDANDELDEGFRPPGEVRPLEMENSYLKLPKLIVLRSGLIVVPNQAGQLMRLNQDGSKDSSFPSGLSHLAEATDGSLWGVRSNTVLHLAQDGSPLSEREIPARTADETVFAIQPDGRLLIRESLLEEWTEIKIKRWLPDGTADPLFEPILGRRAGNGGSGGDEFGILSDGRLAVLSGNSGIFRVFDPNGRIDPSFPPAKFLNYSAAGPKYRFLQWDGRLRVRGPGEAYDINGGVWVFTGPNTYCQFLLTNAPQTALQLTAERRDEFGQVIGSANLNDQDAWGPEGAAFPITFRRLGQRTGPATATFTTRYVSAGQDYVAPPRTVTFARLEVEKTVSIPRLTDPKFQAPEMLEIVVTGGEGFEALPAPLRIFDGFRPEPRVKRVKHLRDGKVLVEYFRSSDSGIIEASSDLRSWQTVKPRSESPLYRGLWLDEEAANFPTRFYRSW